MRILPSALKHGYLEYEMEELLASDITVEVSMSDGRAGPRYMIVGEVSTRDHPLEVGVELPMDSEDEVVFHCDKARDPYVSAYEKRKKKFW